MSVHCEKTPKFFFYVFALGTLILILDSYAPPEEFKFEEEHPVFCRFYQLHLPRQAIQIALHHRPETVGPMFEQALTRRQRKYVMHFLFNDASDEISKILSRNVEDGNGTEDLTAPPVPEILLQ